MTNQFSKTLFTLAVVTAMGMAATVVSVSARADMAMSGSSLSLYQQLGERAGIQKIVNDLIDRSVADPRIAAQFRNAKLDHLKASITDQICAISGGPCKYEGPDMKEAHAEMGLKKSDFLALVDDLEQAMKAQGVPFTVQTKLLALLAPMHRDVVTEH